MTKYITIIVINFVIPKTAPKLELLFNKPASGQASVVVLSIFILNVTIHNVVALFSLLRAESYGNEFLCKDVWSKKQLY